MNILEISGKRYVSTRNAAREYNYHADYIGQLLRAGKVVGTKVGRNWYVEVDSIAAFFDEKPAQGRAKEEVASTRLVVGSKDPIMQSVEKEVELEAGKDEVIKGYNRNLQSLPRTGLTYLTDDSPVMPELHDDYDKFEQRSDAFQSTIVSSCAVGKKVVPVGSPDHKKLTGLNMVFWHIFLCLVSCVVTVGISVFLPYVT